MAEPFEIRIDNAAVVAYLSSASKEVRETLKKAVRAALGVLRRQVAKAAPTQRFREVKQYTSKIRASGPHGIVGRLSARKGAGIIQSGYADHWAPVLVKSGAVNGSLAAWMIANGHGQVLERIGMMVSRRGGRHFVPFAASPSLLAWASANGRLQKTFLHMKAKPGRPWIQQAAQGAEDKARDAFERVVEKAIEKAGA